MPETSLWPATLILPGNVTVGKSKSATSTSHELCKSLELDMSVL